MQREFLQNLQVGDMPLPKEVVDAIMAEHGKAVNAHRQAAQDWEEKYNRATEEHAQALQNAEFNHNFSQAVLHAGGRSEKAISALLDMDALRENPTQEAMDGALQELKKESPYLFAQQTPPPYAPLTGTYPAQNDTPTTLAGALKQKWERK